MGAQMYSALEEECTAVTLARCEANTAQGRVMMCNNTQTTQTLYIRAGHNRWREPSLTCSSSSSARK